MQMREKVGKSRKHCVFPMICGSRGPKSRWQAWHLATWILTLRGRHGTYGTGLALVARLGLSWRRGRRGFWCGRRGTWWHGPSLCVAGVALGDMDPHFAWQAWHLWHWAGSGGALGSQLTPWTPRLLAWQAWHLVTWTFTSQLAPWAPRLLAWQAWHLVTWAFTLRGRRGTWRHGSSLCVAGKALMALGWLWWRAWVSVDAVGAAAFGVAGRGTWWHGPSLCVAGVALGDMDPHFAWQAWHLWHWAGSGGALGSQLTPWAPRLLAWQAWHLVTWTFTLRGRRGTWWHGSSLCVASVALVALGWLWWARLGLRCRRGRRGFLRGRRGTWWHGPSLCVTHIQTCSHTTCPHTTYSHTACPHTELVHVHTHTTWHRRSLCVAGVTLGDMDLHFAWQVWHLVTWYLSVFITPMPPLRSWKK